MPYEIDYPYTLSDGKELPVTLTIPDEHITLDSEGKPKSVNKQFFSQALKDAAKQKYSTRYPNEFGVSPVQSQVEKQLAAGKKLVKPYQVTVSGDPTRTRYTGWTEKSAVHPGDPNYPLDPFERIANIPTSGESVPGKIATGVESAGQIAAMLNPTGLITRPALTAVALGLPASYAAQYGAEKAGMEPGAARLTGDVAGTIAGLPGISPALRSGIVGGMKGALSEAFAEGRGRIWPAYKFLTGAATGAYAGGRMAGTPGAVAGGIVGGTAPFAKGAVTGAIEGARGKPLFDKSIIGTQIKSTGQPSPVFDVSQQRLPPSPVITTPPPEVRGLPAPAGVPATTPGPGTGFTMPPQQQPPVVTGPAQITGRPMRALPPPPEPIITPPPQQPLQIPAPGEAGVTRTGGAIPMPAGEPIPRTGTRTAVAPPVKAPVAAAPAEAKVTAPKVEAPLKAEPTVIPRKPEAKLEGNKLLGFMTKRPGGVTVSEIQENLGASAEEARAKLKTLQEDDQVYNKGGKWYEGKPKEEKPAKIAKEKPAPEVKAPEKKLTDIEKMYGVKKGKPSAEVQSKTPEAEKAPQSESTETASAGESSAAEQPKEYDISHEQIGTLADTLGVTFTQAGRWLTEHGYNVQPSKFGAGKYGLERLGKKTTSGIADAKFEEKFTNLMEMMGKPAPSSQAEDAVLSEVGRTDKTVFGIKDIRKAVNEKLGKDIGTAFDDAVKKLVKSGKLRPSEHDYTDELLKAGYGPEKGDTVEGTKWVFLDPAD